MCGNTSVCGAYAQAETILTGKVKKIENSEIDEKGDYKGNQIAFVEVVKSYKGTSEKVIKLSQQNSNCDWRFENYDVGETFLFYLSKYKNQEQYSVITCGRSAKIEEAADDLSWLDALPESLRRTRISGLVRLKTENYRLLSEFGLKITGKSKTYEVKTKNGLYEIWDVPAGQYSIMPSLGSEYALKTSSSIPENWTYFWSFDEKDLNALKITIEPKSCGGIDFTLERKNDEK